MFKRTNKTLWLYTKFFKIVDKLKNNSFYYYKSSGGLALPSFISLITVLTYFNLF